MIIREGDVIPGKSISHFVLGMTYETISEMLNYDYSVCKNTSIGFYDLTTENAKFYFNKDNRLYQIGVTIGFTSKLDNCIGIGSTMTDVKKKYGGYSEEYDVYLIHGVKGICFELGDMDEIDDWDELMAPIEWIFVYDSDLGTLDPNE